MRRLSSVRCDRFLWLPCLLVMINSAWATRALAQSQFSQAVDQLAGDLAEVLATSGELLVTVTYGGVPGLGARNTSGFLSVFGDALINLGVAPDPAAPLRFVVRLEPVLDDRPPRAYLVGVLSGSGQPTDGRIIRGRWMIDDAAELAQWAGISADLPPGPRRARGIGFRRALDDADISLSPDRLRLFESNAFRFGIGVGVGAVGHDGGKLQGRGRRLTITSASASEGPPAVAVVRMRQGDAFYVELINNERFEVAVALAIDGLGSFRYSTRRKPDGSSYRYHIVPPHSSVVVGGWERGNGVGNSRFEVSSAADSQAKREGIAVDSIGVITATVHACWKVAGTPPPDEPAVRESDVMEVPVTVTETRTKSIVVNGTPQTYSYLAPITETRTVSVGTKFGTTFEQPSIGVERLIGVPRAVLALRYETP